MKAVWIIMATVAKRRVECLTQAADVMEESVTASSCRWSVQKKWVAGVFAASLCLMAAASPCAAQSFGGQAAYDELLKKADPSDIVLIDGRPYLRAPSTTSALPGGYNGIYDTRKFMTADGKKEVVVIDPERPIQITKNKTAPDPESFLERARKIEAALAKLGLHADHQSLREAVGGYRVLATDMLNGEEKPNGTRTIVYVHVGADDKIQLLYEKGKQIASGSPLIASGFSQIGSISPRADWTCWTTHDLSPLDGRNRGKSAQAGADYAQIGVARADCVKKNAVATVEVTRFDSLTVTQLHEQLHDTDYASKAFNNLAASRTASLALQAKSQVENWMKVVAKLVDETEQASSPPVVKTEQPKPKPQPPPVAATKPEAPAVAEAKPKPNLLNSILNYWNNPKPKPKPPADAAAQNQPSAKDDARSMMNVGLGMTAGGLALGAIGVVASAPLWPGAVLTGVGAMVAGQAWLKLHGAKPADLAPEIPGFEAVKNARDLVKKAQDSHWEQLSDPELAEMIKLDDLSKMTKEQRAEVYAEAGAPLQSRVEALIELKKHPEWLNPEAQK